MTAADVVTAVLAVLVPVVFLRYGNRPPMTAFLLGLVVGASVGGFVVALGVAASRGDDLGPLTPGLWVVLVADDGELARAEPLDPPAPKGNPHDT